MVSFKESYYNKLAKKKMKWKQEKNNAIIKNFLKNKKTLVFPLHN